VHPSPSDFSFSRQPLDSLGKFVEGTGTQRLFSSSNGRFQWFESSCLSVSDARKTMFKSVSMDIPNQNNSAPSEKMLKSCGFFSPKVDPVASKTRFIDGLRLSFVFENLYTISFP
jgi:hypothetical protein